MGKLSLYLLGDLHIELDGKPIDTIATEKARALLVYLVLERERPIRRGALAELFWPERPPGAGRASLRQALGNIRTALGDRNNPSPFILTHRDHIQFCSNESIWVDAITVQDLLRSVRNHEHQPGESCQACESSLATALDLYKGDFLDEFSLPDSQGFHEWTTVRREGLHHQISGALRLLVNLLETRGAHKEACRHAQKLVVHEPWSEGNHRILIRMLAITGRRSQAMRQFKTCQRILHEEFDAAPSDETLTLLQQIRDGQIELLMIVPGPASADPEGRIRRNTPLWRRYGAMIMATTAIIALGSFGLLNLGILSGNGTPQPATITQTHLHPQITISPVDLDQYNEAPYGNSTSPRMCGEEAFGGNLNTQDPLFLRPDRYFDGWISLDPSTVVLPDNTSLTYAIPLVLVVIDLPWVQIQDAMMHTTGLAHAWGCWYPRDQQKQAVEDAILDLCMKQAGGQFAVLHRVSSAGFEELGTTETITCP
jgi:DNA-binding SARP family transcriptional activator